MNTPTEIADTQNTVMRHPIRYPVSAYTFPGEARIREAHIDDAYIRIELEDGRLLAIPLHWVPTVSHAAPEARAKFRINRSRTMLVWDPSEGSINDELRVQDYLGPSVNAE